MKSLFNLDNPFMQFLSRVADLILLNVMLILLSLPVFTAGAALAALHRVCQNMVFETDSGVFRPFLRAFRDNFRQATLVWLAELVVTAALVCDALLVMAYFGKSTVMYVLLGVLAFLVAGVCAYLIPLIARYNNTLRQHLNNAMVLAVIKLPKTLLLTLMNLLPILLALLSLEVFVQTLIFWVIIGFAFMAFLQESLLRNVYEQLEKGTQSVTLGM